MTGWTAVAVLTALMLVVLVGVNVRLYRRMRAATVEGKRRSADAGQVVGADDPSRPG